MVDFKAKLEAERAKKALEKQLNKIKGDSAPSMNPSWNPRKKKEDEPLPPDLKDLPIPLKDKVKLRRLITEYNALGITKSASAKRQKILSEEIKPLCKIYNLDKFMVEGARSAYYKTVRTSISKELLLAHNVSPEVIAACTVSNTVWAFKVSGSGVDNDTDEEGEDN